jgi:hypothetical protein
LFAARESVDMYLDVVFQMTDEKDAAVTAADGLRLARQGYECAAAAWADGANWCCARRPVWRRQRMACNGRSLLVEQL